MSQISMYRKDSIIITTIEIISELGIQGLTSKEIAKREKISEGTLFSHFKNMNEIILSALNYHSELDESIIETVEAKNISPIEAIKLFIAIHSENYENYPESTSLIFVSHMLVQKEETAIRAEEIMENRTKYLKSLIEKAQKVGGINRSADSELLTDLIIGYFRVIVQKWRKSNYSFKLKQQILEDLDIFLKAFIK